MGHEYRLEVWVYVDGKKECVVEYYKSFANAEDAYKEFSGCVDVVAEKLSDVSTGEVFYEYDDASKWEDDSEVTDDV